MNLDQRLIYVQWKQKISSSNYIALGGVTDPVTGSRARILFMPENEMITRMRRCDFESLLKKRYGQKIRQLSNDEVPDNIRSVFEKREAKSAAVKSAAKKPVARKAKKAAKKGKGA